MLVQDHVPKVKVRGNNGAWRATMQPHDGPSQKPCGNAAPSNTRRISLSGSAGHTTPSRTKSTWNGGDSRMWRLRPSRQSWCPACEGRPVIQLADKY